MPEDYIPDSFQNRYDWAKNIHDNLDQYAAALGLDSGEVSTIKGRLSAIVTNYKAVLDAQRVLDTTVGTANSGFDVAAPELRRQFAACRKSVGYNDGIGSALAIAPVGGKAAPASIKPRLKAESHLGFVPITGRKSYAETVNIYMRIAGQTQWKLVVAKRKTFPFDDQTPPAQPGVAERREYMAIGCIGDSEVGQPSDIITVLHG